MMSVNSFILKTTLIFALILMCGCSNLDIQKLNNKAAELMQQGDIDGAIGRLESIQDLNPNFPPTNYNLGLAYKEKGDYDKSIHYLTKAVELKPDLYQAHLSLTVIYEELSDTLIQEEVDKLEKKDPNSLSSIEDIEFSVEQREKLSQYYTKAKNSIEDYLKYAPVPEDKELLQQKIVEFEKKISHYSSPTNSDKEASTNKTE